MEPTSAAPTQDERMTAAIGYLGIFCLVPLLLRKHSPFAQHHGRQGLVLLLAWILLWAGNIVPFVGQIVWILGSIPLLILLILGVVNALNGRLWDMPVLGGYAKEIKI